MSWIVRVSPNGASKWVRASALAALSSLILAGCASSERWQSTSFDSGYTEKTAQASAKSKPTATAQAYSRAPERYASNANGAPDGYLQVSRVDLPPLASQNVADQDRVRMADGYGAYNKTPLSDGTYAGPRVYTPYDGPRDGALNAPPPPPRLPPYGGPGNGNVRVYERAGDGPPTPYSKPPRWSRPGPGPDASNRGPREAPPPPPAYGGGAYGGGPGPYREGAADAGPGPYRPVAEGGPGPRPGFVEGGPGSRPGFGEEGPDFYAPKPRGSYTGPPREYSPFRPQYGAEQSSNREIKKPFDSVAADRGNGTVITVTPGETVYTLAIRYGVTVNRIIAANGLNGREVRPGDELLIPNAGPLNFAAVPKQKVATDAACVAPACHVVKSGDTIGSLSRQYGVPEKQLLEANRLSRPQELKAGMAIAIPQIEKARPEKRTEAPQAPAAKKVEAAPPPPAAEEPAKKLAALSAPAEPAEASCDAALSNPMPRTGKTFRKPVEGLMINQFGPQRDGSVQEGVTFSVPKGTPIKAAENGVVAYVGDELAGFGNLILIRHADDYVTAYANSDEVLVKKCDVIKRGQVIAKAGATGGVPQPQLHFEIRKSSKAVDPVPLFSS